MSGAAKNINYDSSHQTLIAALTSAQHRLYVEYLEKIESKAWICAGAFIMLMLVFFLFALLCDDQVSLLISGLFAHASFGAFLCGVCISVYIIKFENKNQG